MSKIFFAGRQTDGGNVAPGSGGARREGCVCVRACVCVSTKSLDQYIYTQKDTLGHQQLYTAHNLSDSSVLFIPTVPVQNITTHTEGAIVLG
jgi:hypothetical protein